MPLILIPAVFICLFSSLMHVHAEEEDIRYITAVYPSATVGSNLEVKVPYSDRWFFESSSVYNHRLAQASIGLTLSAFRLADYQAGLEGQDEHIRSFLSEAGFTDVRTNDYDRMSGRYTIASAMGHKEIKRNGETYELIAIGISGQGYNNEWLSNLSIGDQDLHRGFADAAEDIYDRFFGYIALNGLDEKNIRVWVSGFSRAAAVANVFAAQVIDSEWFEPQDVFAYTFATPATTRNPEAGSYSGIFNIVGATDPTPMVPFENWNYGRFGTTLLNPTQQTDSDWYEKKERANQIFQNLTGIAFWNNVEIDMALHTALYYLSNIVPSVDIYAKNMEGRVLNLWNNKSLGNALRTLFDFSDDKNLINDENRDMANELMDFIFSEVIYSISDDNETLDWKESVSVGGNLMHEHTPDVYIAWLFSSDNPDEIYCPNQKFSLITVSGNTDVCIYEGEREVFHANKTESGPAEGSSSVFAVFSAAEGVKIIVPEDRGYSVRLVSNADQNVKFIRDCMTSNEFSRNVRCQIEFNMKAGDETMIAFEGDDTVYEKRDASSADTGETPGDIGIMDRGRITFQDFNILHLSWKNLVISCISFIDLMISLLLFCILAVWKSIRVSQKIREGVLPEGTKPHLPVLFALTSVFALYNLMHGYSTLYPFDTITRFCFKAVIAVILILVMWYGYNKVKSSLHRTTLISLILITAGDLLMVLPFYPGLLLEWLGILLLGIGFVRYEKPSAPQWIGFACMSLLGSFALIRSTDGDILQKAAAVIYFSTLVFLLFASLRAPKRYSFGSAFLLSAGVLNIYSQIFLTDVFSNVMIGYFVGGFFYIGLGFFVTAPLKVIDSSETKPAADTSLAVSA